MCYNFKMKENTRQRLIDATYEEVYSHGYQGAALADILANAGVHKGSMYHFFPNKKEMALSAIKEKMGERFATRYQAIKESDGRYLEQFFAMLRDGNIRDFKRGCPLANLVQEMSNIDEDFDRTLKVIYAQFRKILKSIYDAAIRAGEMRECDTGKLALFSVSLLEGALLSAKASGKPQDYFDSVEMLIGYIESLRY